MNMKNEISVVIPVYRGEKTLSALIQDLNKELSKFCSKYEIILVNDDSPDKCWSLIRDLIKKYPFIKGIKLMRNYGQHNATLSGVRAAQYPITITMDDDLQHPAREIKSLVEKLDEGYDVVYGAPRKLPQGFFRNIATSWTKAILAYVMGVPSVKKISAFRAFRTDLRKAFENFQSPHVTLDVLLSWGSSRFTYILVDVAEPPDGKSNYNFKRLAREAILVLTGYSIAPLRFASIMGFIMTFIGVIVLIYVLVIYLFVGSIPGFPFLASLISVFSGTQLFALGIFGEYLGRIFNRSMDRPPYVVDEIIGGVQK
jgi:glycosyltransferase involved in cell wall biosynthesis